MLASLSADCQTAYADGRLTDVGRHAAAQRTAHALTHGHMLADAVNPHEDLIAFSDERRAAHGGNNLAVADEIAFLHGEIEFIDGSVVIPESAGYAL